MHTRTVALAALVVAASSAATTARADEDSRWTIGAGVGNIGGLVIVGSATPSLLGLAQDTSPAATFFLERRLGPRTWLMFTGSGSVSRATLDPPPVAGVGLATATDSDSERISGAVGLRQVVTGPGAVADLSFYATIGGGYAHDHSEFADGTGAVTTFRDSTGFASLEGGIAVERTLTGGLAVRISTPLVAAAWARLERRDGTGTRDGSSFATSVTVAPRIELRLAF